MLDCRSNRLDYGESLCPPSGYTLDAAVATTYSANLSTILSIPVALVYSETLEGDLSAARLELLEAIKQFSNKVKIYHQEGRLHIPTQLNWLYAHLESCTEGILMEDAYTAFHPKTWLIRYTPKEETSTSPIIYRLLVLSRNLTFDRNWDVAATFDGEVTNSVYETNRPLIDFHQWLNDKSPFPGAKTILKELPQVEFDIPPPFDAFSFHPIGIDNYPQNPTTEQTADRSLVISPFLHPKFLSELDLSRMYLFSQQNELAKMTLSLLHSTNCYQLKPFIVDGEFIDLTEEGDYDQQQQNLHAKFYCFENEAETRCFLGSANATEAATKRNVEFLIELQSERQKSFIDQLLQQLVGDDEHIGAFERAEITEADQFDSDEYQKELRIRKFEYTLLKSTRSAHVERSANQKNYDVYFQINLPIGHPEIDAWIKPFNVSDGIQAQQITPGEHCELRFQNISEVELSQFFEVKIESSSGESHQFLFKTEMTGLPEDRFDNLLAKLIDSSQKFFDYLQFLISDEITKEDLLAMGEAEELSPTETTDTESWSMGQSPIFEQLLIAASRYPSRLKAVDEIVNSLKDNPENAKIIPNEFLEFWQSFESFIPKAKS